MEYMIKIQKYPDAQLIETVSSLEQIETGEETNIDVTGGMGGKYVNYWVFST